MTPGAAKKSLRNTPDGESGGEIRLRLYVDSSSGSSRLMEALFEGLMQSAFGRRLRVDRVDIRREPDRAARDSILAVPTLVRLWPEPRLRMVGVPAGRERLKEMILDAL